MSANLENPEVATGLEKINPHPNSQEGYYQKCANHWTITLILYASNAVLIVLRARFQDYVSQEIPDVQAGFS